MTLSDIADGLCVTTEQRDRGVASTDETDRTLAERLAEYETDLPCDAPAAAAVVDAYTGGAAIDAAGHDAGVTPMAAAKVLHLLGLDGVSPLAPAGRRIVRDWLDARVSRADARALTGAGAQEFALAAFVEAHDPLPGAEDVVTGALSRSGNAAVHKRDALAETMHGADEFW
ncbi:DUF7858 family protein [Haloarchaeobius amylolyticus]|uniref:DUF7858 family protein n=1 Tax=Haloarchaeobius amylolyticus TaxID=1198296 RepID=UPI00226DBFCF|nr:hypothetical protein [Haloarchaeobius amylolyticus]